MALKPHRHEDVTDISFFSNVTSQERGVMMVHDTSGSGAAMDQSVANVIVPTGSASGSNPAGILLNDIVNRDLTYTHLNAHKDEVQTGGKVTLLRRGWVVTDQIKTGDTPSAGDIAYYDVNGEFTNTQPAGVNQVGRFLSGLDADGYAKVEVNL